MMPEQGTWRISTAYDYVNDLDAPDLAWEFLRRNPEYQQHYARLSLEGDDDTLAAALSDKWGLSFRGQSRTVGTDCKSHVDSKSRSLDPDTASAAELERATATG
jgi:hypothetical protein